MSGPVILLCALCVCYTLEFVRPLASRMPIATWVWRVWLLNSIHLLVALAIVAAWSWMARQPVALLHLSTRLTTAGAAGVGYLAYTFVFYWWHRARHASDAIWRTLHQIHHSARRLETVTAFYKHPLETIVNAVIAGVLMFWVLGLDVHAAAACTVLAGLADFFYHANLRTPAWIGLFVQRPKMHRLHHECDRHEGNYGDLPVWDFLFGTLRLPTTADVACGFTPEREERLGEMLRGVDVHRVDRA